MVSNVNDSLINTPYNLRRDSSSTFSFATLPMKAKGRRSPPMGVNSQCPRTLKLKRTLRSSSFTASFSSEETEARMGKETGPQLCDKPVSGDHGTKSRSPWSQSRQRPQQWGRTWRLNTQDWAAWEFTVWIKAKTVQNNRQLGSPGVMLRFGRSGFRCRLRRSQGM